MELPSGVTKDGENRGSSLPTVAEPKRNSTVESLIPALSSAAKIGQGVNDYATGAQSGHLANGAGEDPHTCR